MITEKKTKSKRKESKTNFFLSISDKFLFYFLSLFDLIKKRKETLILPSSCRARIHCFKMEMTSEFH